MELLVRVKSQSPLKTRNWETSNGESRVINSVELEVTNGIDNFVCEATDNLALQLASHPLNSESVYSVQCRLSVRHWQSRQTNEDMWANSVRLINIATV